jgi:hypothetical protein
MLRTGAIRSLARLGQTSAPARNITSSAGSKSAKSLQSYTQSRVSGFNGNQALAVASFRPATTSLRHYVTTHDGIDSKLEKQAAKEKLEQHPESVSTSSSVRQLLHEKGVPDPEKEVDMMAGIKADMVRGFMPVQGMESGLIRPSPPWQFSWPIRIVMT